MKTVIVVLAGLVALLILGFIAWATGWSFTALFAGFFLLLFVATAVGITSLPSFVKTILVAASVLCLIVILWAVASKLQKENDLKKAAEAATKPKAAPAVKPVTVLKEVSKEPIDYLFADYPGMNNCIPVFMPSARDIVPLKEEGVEGKVSVSITPPAGRGKPFTVVAGDAFKKSFTYSEKPYMVCKPADSIAIGFRIYPL